MAALEQAVRPLERAMAYLNIRLRIRAIHCGLASRIAVVVGRELMQAGNLVIQEQDTVAVMAALMAVTATLGQVVGRHLPLAA